MESHVTEVHQHAIAARLYDKFATPTWRKAQVLLVGAILPPGKRTVSSALQALGLPKERACVRYHHVLSRATWSSLAMSRVLLRLLVQHLGPTTGPLCLGIDETMERPKGPRIAAKGVYRDGVRSSRGHFVKAMGLRWVSLKWLVQLPWTRRVWALTVLVPSTRYHADRGRRHQTVTDWARQMLCCVRCWLPDRALVVVDSIAKETVRQPLRKTNCILGGSRRGV